MELKIIAASIQSREAYDQVLLQEMDKEFSPKSMEIFKSITHYYTIDDRATSCDLEVLRSSFSRLPDKRGEIFLALLDQLPEVSVDNIIEYILETKKDRIKDNMLVAIQRYDNQDLEQEITKYQALQALEESGGGYESYIGVGIEDLLENNRTENLIKLAPANLNKRLDGGLPRGENTNILIYASPEVGKTLFAINLARIFCRQGLKVCYIGNEDSSGRMRFRFLSRFASTSDTAYPKALILKYPELAFKRAMEHGYENLRFIPLSPGTIHDLTKVVDRYKPDVLFIDQMRNILYPKSTGETDQISKVSSFVRSLGKAANIITINVCQANIAYHKDDDTVTTSKLILSMSDIFGSNVSVPGDMDLQFGLGMDDSMLVNGRRLLSITRNKISGWHGVVAIKIFPEISRCEGLT